MTASANNPPPPASKKVHAPVPRNVLEDYLEDYLVEEFRNFPQIRIRRVPQDHVDGILVRSEAREYFFPFEWMGPGRFKEVQAQVKKILDLLV
jgi:hypothetical protein